MKNISIVASGSRGDVQPYVALGRGLREAGYHVRILTSDSFQTLVTEAGLEFCSTGESIEDVLKSEAWGKTLESGNFLAILAKMRSEMQGRAVGLAQKIPALLEGSDLILAGMAAMGGVIPIADMLGIPIIITHVFPFTPTREFPSPLVPGLPFGTLLNKPSFHITHQMFWQTSNTVDVTTRKMLGLPKGSMWGPFPELARRRIPTLYGYSPRLLPRPKDWPEHHIVTGYWFLDAPTGWTPPADLVDFLNAGAPPVYIGFGSMGGRNPKEAGRIALEALERTGQRGVLASGWGGLTVSDVPKTVHLISSIPHAWLFPRMAAVVHHGGAGTTAAGLRAGVPSIIVPFMGDQAFWGKRLADIGVGTTPIPRKKLTSEQLAGAISKAISDKTMIRRASEMGEYIRAEDGVGNAVAFIDRFMEQRGEIRREPVTV
jgi:sterol 3beta-glucosyltransferase